MKKSHRFNEMSDQTCQGKDCSRKLKLRRVEKYGDTLCYRCYIKTKLRAGCWNNHGGKKKRAGLI